MVIVLQMIYGCGDTYCTLAVEDGGDINGGI